MLNLKLLVMTHRNAKQNLYVINDSNRIETNITKFTWSFEQLANNVPKMEEGGGNLVTDNISIPERNEATRRTINRTENWAKQNV